MSETVQSTEIIDGVSLVVHDSAGAGSTLGVVKELREDCYGVRELNLQPGDVVVDIGAHTGAFACFLALRYGVRAYSYELAADNFRHLQLTIAANGVADLVEPHHAGVSSDGRAVWVVTPSYNTGGGSSFYVGDPSGHLVSEAPSTTLDAIFERYAIERCALLKVDCEGMEFEVLRTFAAWASVANLGMEVHDFGDIPDRDVPGLLKLCASRVSGQVRTVVIASPHNGFEWT